MLDLTFRDLKTLAVFLDSVYDCPRGTSGDDFWLRSIDAQGKGFGVAVKPRDLRSLTMSLFHGNFKIFQ